MMTDPIADMLTRIRNAVSVERPTVDVPVSKVKRGLAEVLKREGFIWDWSEVEAAPVKLELKGLSRRKYFSDISFKLHKGEILGIVVQVLVGEVKDDILELIGYISQRELFRKTSPRRMS